MRRVTSRSGAPATRRTVYSPGDSVASTRNRSPPGSPWERLGFDESGASWVWSRLHLLVDPLGARVEGGVSGARSASLVLEGFLALELEHERGSGPGLQCLGGSGRPSSRRQNIVARTILRQKVGAADTLWPRKERELSGGLGTSFGGLGPPILLLHGFPQTHLMWRGVAPILARDFAVVCADLRGYGLSGCPPSAPDHAPYSKRAMAQDLVTVMERLGFPRFSVAGHDRGGRVAYRMALDHPDRVERLAVLDVLPTETVWDLADARFALAYWPLSLLAQPEPLPERILAASPEAIVADALGGWGTPSDVFPPDVHAAYVEALRPPGHAHAICEEYRAAATIDRQHDRADLASGHRIACPILALWSAPGPLGTWYAQEGGPIAIWRAWGDDVRGGTLEAGHFFPEEAPERTADALDRFFGGAQ